MQDALDDGGVISGLVFDELAYRLVLAWLRDDGCSDPLSTYRADPGAAMRVARRRLTAGLAGDRFPSPSSCNRQTTR